VKKSDVAAGVAPAPTAIELLAADSDAPRVFDPSADNVSNRVCVAVDDAASPCD
jgi:hypothetical protein